MKFTQTSFPQNKHIAFIQLSAPNVLFHGCWAEPGERVLVLGYRKGAHDKLLTAITHASATLSYNPLDCHGTSVAGGFKAVVSNEPVKIRTFLNELESKALLSKAERDRAVAELGVRGAPLHPFMPGLTLDGHGAGI